MKDYLKKLSQPHHLTISVKAAHVAIMAICLALGVLAGLVTFARGKGELPLAGMRLETLALMYTDAKDEIIRSQKEIDRLRGQLQSYEDAATANTGLAKEMRDELQELRALVGILPVKGPGILVTLTDAPRATEGGEELGGPEEAMLVHDQDLIQLVNELRCAGAEAISINDQRMGALSDIRCSGPVIRVNGSQVAGPFRIKVIGDKDALYSALTIRGGYKERLEQYGPTVTIQKRDLLELPAIAASPELDRARPVLPAEKPATGGE